MQISEQNLGSGRVSGAGAIARRANEPPGPRWRWLAGSFLVLALLGSFTACASASGGAGSPAPEIAAVMEDPIPDDDLPDDPPVVCDAEDIPGGGGDVVAAPPHGDLPAAGPVIDRAAGCESPDELSPNGNGAAVGLCLEPNACEQATGTAIRAKADAIEAAKQALDAANRRYGDLACRARSHPLLVDELIVAQLAAAKAAAELARLKAELRELWAVLVLCRHPNDPDMLCEQAKAITEIARAKLSEASSVRHAARRELELARERFEKGILLKQDLKPKEEAAAAAEAAFKNAETALEQAVKNEQAVCGK